MAEFSLDIDEIKNDVETTIKEEEINLNLFKNYNITKDDIINNLIKIK